MQESYPSPSAGSHSTDTQQQGCALFVRTLRFRLIALGFLANLLLVGMMLLIMLFSWEHSTRQALQVRSYEVRQLLQAVLQEPLRYEDYPRVVDLVNQSFTQSDLLYLAVENQQGQQIALLQQSQIIPSPSRQQEALASVSLLFSLSEGVYQRSVITDGGKVIGQVSYVLSLQTATAALKTLLLQVLLVMVVSILLLGLLTALIGLWIGRPLSALIRAARAIADGDYQASLPPSNANEIGRLAAAFAQMRDALREQMSTLRVVFRRRLHEISGVGCTARTGRLQGSVESGFSYLEACGGLADIQAVGDKLPRSLQLVGSDNRLASAFAPACGGSGQPGLGALADQVALELAQRTEHMEDEPSARRGGVDVFSQRAEADAPCFQLADRLNQVRQGAAKPIQPPDDQHIAIAQISQRIGQAGPVCLGPGCRVLENPFAACIAQRIRLQGGVLFRRRYPRIADECHFRPFVRYTVRLSYCPSSRCARCFRTGVRFGRLMIV